MHTPGLGVVWGSNSVEFPPTVGGVHVETKASIFVGSKPTSVERKGMCEWLCDGTSVGLRKAQTEGAATRLQCI